MFEQILSPPTLIFLIPIVAIVTGGVLKFQKMRFEHEERLAKIDAGMDPDEIYEDEYEAEEEKLILKERMFSKR